MPSDTDPKPPPAILSRVCAVCGAPSAPWGFRNPNSDADPGKWYCGAHKDAGREAWKRAMGAG